MKIPERPSSPRAGKGEIKATFVTRLERLIRLRHEYREDLNPLGFRLLDRAIYATYQDCIDYGATNQAKALMANHEVAGWDEAPERL